MPTKNAEVYLLSIYGWYLSFINLWTPSWTLSGSDLEKPEAQSYAVWLDHKFIQREIWRANFEKKSLSACLQHLILHRSIGAYPADGQHVRRGVHAEQSDCIIWACSSICVAASTETLSSCVTHNSVKVWEMEEGNHAKWTYSPACRKITGGWTISHSLLPTELQIPHLQKQKVTRNLTKEQRFGRRRVNKQKNK